MKKNCYLMICCLTVGLCLANTGKAKTPEGQESLLTTLDGRYAVNITGPQSVDFAGLGSTIYLQNLLGDSLAAPIVVASLPYMTIGSTDSCYTDQYPERSSKDVFFQFTTGNCVNNIILSTCSDTTDFDTYLFLLDDTGAEVTSNDDAATGTCAFTLNGSNRFSIIDAAVTANTTYYVVVEGFSSPDSGTFQLSIEEMGLTIIGGSTIANVSCSAAADGSISLAPSGGLAPYSYLWSNGSTDAMITGLEAGDYTSTITDSNGCNSVETATVMEPTALGVTIISTDETAPNANDGTATATVVGGTLPYSYAWSEGTAGVDNISNLPPGQYCLTVVDAAACEVVSCATVDMAVATVEIQELENISLRPNLTDGEAQLILSFSKSVDLELQVVNTLGQVIWVVNDKQVVNGQYTLDLQDAPAGVYFVRIKVGNHFAVKRLLVAQ